MKFSNVRRVLRKELKETLRDRRTLMIMVVVPIFLYPLLLIVIEQMALFGQRQIEQEPASVVVVGGSPGLLEFLQADTTLRVQTASELPEERLRAGEVEVGLELSRAPARGAQASDTVRIFYDASQDRAQRAHAAVSGRLRAWTDTLLARRLEAEGLPGTFAQPLVLADSSLASPERLGRYALGRFLPMLLILITLLGAFYPAIDLTAGEKERGTLETLLTSPVSAREVVWGKFLVVTLLALSAGALNLASMLLTFESGIFRMAQEAGLEMRLPLDTVLLLLLFLVPLAILFSALFLGIAVRAQSFKEGQNLLTPVQILSFVPTYLPLIPGISFSYTLAVVPIGGVALMFREMMTGSAPLGPSLVALGSTVLYAALALGFAAKSFGSEEVLFGSGSGEMEQKKGSLAERLRGWRSPAATLPRPLVSLLFVGGVGLLYFYLALRFQVWGITQGIFAAQWLLLGLPALLFALGGPFRVRETLALRAPSPRALIAAVLIIGGGIPVGWMLGWLQSFFLEIPTEFLQAFADFLKADTPAEFLWLLLVIAITPAICEELVFRGVLLQGFSSEWTMKKSVLVSALVFGGFHLSFETVIRFLPTAWLGLLLGYVAWHTRSIFATMLMHFLNNGVVLLLVAASSWQAYVLGPEGAPRWIAVVLGAISLVLGLRLLPKRQAQRIREERAEPEPQSLTEHPGTSSL